MTKFLICQTAFIGDVILATPIIELLKKQYPNCQIDFLLRKGNESLLQNHPHLNELLIWDKKGKKYANLIQILKSVRKTKYDYIINLQRFASSGLFTAFSKAKNKIGFKKNPLSFLFTKAVPHNIGDGTHETDRNISLIENLVDKHHQAPVLHPQESDYDKIYKFQEGRYVCMAPASVWYTKQLSTGQWINLCNNISEDIKIFFIGAPGDGEMCEFIAQNSNRGNFLNLCGKITLLQSAALMEGAAMNYVNDSAPMHLASSVNAPVTAFFCSTVPEFGFGPLSDNALVAQIEEELPCRPCGLHGKKSCPKKHFNCSENIPVNKFAI